MLHLPYIPDTIYVYILNIIRVIKLRRMRWSEHVVHMGQVRNACRILVGKPEGKRPRGRTRCGRKDNIKMALRDIQFRSVDCIHYG
jgi:hypothetical protein